MLKSILNKLEEMEKSGYDFSSEILSELEDNVEQISYFKSFFERVILTSNDENLLELSVWGLFWNRQEIIEDVLNNILETCKREAVDFSLRNSIIYGLGISFRGSGNKIIVDHLNSIINDNNVCWDLRCSSVLSKIEVIKGIPKAQILMQCELLPSQLSNSQTFNKLLKFEKQK